MSVVKGAHPDREYSDGGESEGTGDEVDVILDAVAEEWRGFQRDHERLGDRHAARRVHDKLEALTLIRERLSARLSMEGGEERLRERLLSVGAEVLGRRAYERTLNELPLVTPRWDEADPKIKAAFIYQAQADLDHFVLPAVATAQKPQDEEERYLERLAADPVGRCAKCHRACWDSPQLNTTCGMLQPDGSRCDGKFVPGPQPQDEEER